ncbi:hypothetical protein Aperf_G00000108142 [Anoplocephala perfoliata]
MTEIENKENLQMVLNELAKFADESSAVSRLEEKNETIMSLLSSLNRSFTAKVYVSQGVRLQSVSLLSKICSGADEDKNLLAIVNAGGTRVIFQALRVEFAETAPNDELLFKIHKLLCKLAPIDRRFALRAKLSQCIQVTVSLLRIQVARILFFIGSRSSTNAPASASTSANSSHNTRSSCNLIRLGGNRRNPPTCRSSNSRLPSSLTSNIRVLLTTLRCYCSHRGRSNAAALGRLGVVNLLLRALAGVSDLPHNSRNFISVIVGNSGASLNSDEIIDGVMAESWDPKGNVEKGLLVNFSTIGQILTTLCALMKWRHNVIRALSAGATPLLLDLFMALHRCDENGRLVEQQLIIVTALQMITELKVGRRALVTSGGLFYLFALCASKLTAKPPASFKAAKTAEVLGLRDQSQRPASRSLPQLVVPTSTASPVSLSLSLASSSHSSRSSSKISLSGSMTVSSMSSMVDDDPLLDSDKLARQMESVLSGTCDLLRRCCPYLRLPITPLEPVLRVAFNEGKEKAAICSKSEKSITLSNFMPWPLITQKSVFHLMRLCRLSLPIRAAPFYALTPNSIVTYNISGTGTKIPLIANLKQPSIADEGGNITPTPLPTNLHTKVRRSKSFHQIIPARKSSRNVIGHVSVEISKTPSKVKTTNVRRKTKKCKKTAVRQETARSITGPNLDGILLPGIFCSPAEPLRGRPLINIVDHQGSSSSLLHFKGLLSTVEVRNAVSDGDLHDNSNVNNTSDRETQRIKRFSRLNRSRAKSLQKTSALPTSLDNSNHHSNHDSRRPDSQRSRNFNKPAECDGDIFANANNYFEPDSEAEEFVVEEADLEDDEGRLDADDPNSSSACATPDILDGMDDFDAMPTKFGLSELLESHGAFFPEWKEVPGLGVKVDLPKERIAENVKEETYEAMLKAANGTSSVPGQYLVAARQVHSALDYAVHQAEKMIAYPDLFDAGGPDYREHLHSSRLLCDQTMVPPNDCHGDCATASRLTELDPLKIFCPMIPLTLDDVRRIVDGEDLIDRVVFDLDELILQEKVADNIRNGTVLGNSDELLLDKFDARLGHLQFESRFESGNLRKVIQIRQTEYDLLLSPDLNTRTHVQWFYFRVSNMDSAVRYRFNIINLEKPGSQFNRGMQPVVFSVKEAMNGRPTWYRAGGCIKYYKNHFVRRGTHTKNSRNYFTATFSLQFKHRGDVCYIAYHYPYTHSRLLADLTSWQLRARNATASTECQNSTRMGSKLYFRVQNLTSTLLDNLVPLVTVTEADCDSADPKGSPRPYIVITARVHPGESNSSWVMRGLLDKLTDPNDAEMSRLRRSYVFKIVPSLNPDGVICGNHRCSMAGRDLNRQWLSPSQTLHPTIFHTKCLINLLSEMGNSPYIYLDLHGHSRMKDIFVYGCDPRLSWKSTDALDNSDSTTLGQYDTCFLDLAEIMHDISPPFSKSASEYCICRMKEATGRVVVWRQFGVARSYTLESSYCGTTRNCWQEDIAATNGHQISPSILQDVGVALCKAFAYLDPNSKRNA